MEYRGVDGPDQHETLRVARDVSTRLEAWVRHCTRPVETFVGVQLFFGERGDNLPIRTGVLD
jgi:hypothetical protein